MVRKIGVLKNLTEFHLSLGQLPACKFIGKEIWHRCFPVNFWENFNNIFFIEHLFYGTSLNFTKKKTLLKVVFLEVEIALALIL